MSGVLSWLIEAEVVAEEVIVVDEVVGVDVMAADVAAACGPVADLPGVRAFRGPLAVAVATLEGELADYTRHPTRVAMSSLRVAVEVAKTLWPRVSFWRPPWDNLPAR